MKNHIDTITKFIAGQMDGEPVPCSSSKELDQLTAAVRAVVQNTAKDSTCPMLGMMVIGILIDRIGSNLAAEKTLQKFIRGGGHA